jgi:hypothetical protein
MLVISDYPTLFDRKVFLSNFCDFNLLEDKNFYILVNGDIVKNPDVIEMLKRTSSR